MKMKSHRANSKLGKIIEIVQEATGKMTQDHIAAFSAQSAFFILLSFFPFVMLILTLTQYLPFTQGDVTKLFLSVAPTEFSSYIVMIIDDLYQKASVSVISISVIFTLWSASKGILSLTNGFNAVFRIEESRGYFILRGISTIYTFMMLLILAVMLSLFVFGNKLFHSLIEHIPAINNIVGLIANLRTVVSLVIMVLFFLLVYTALPNRKSKWKKQIPGAIFTTVAWIGLSYALSIYMNNFSNFSYMYGSLTGIILVIIWLYFSMYVVFLGAEINCFLENGYLTRIKNVLK